MIKRKKLNCTIESSDQEEELNYHLLIQIRKKPTPPVDSDQEEETQLPPVDSDQEEETQPTVDSDQEEETQSLLIQIKRKKPGRYRSVLHNYTK